VKPGEGTEDTRRRTTLSELQTQVEEQQDVTQVVKAFVDAHLLVTSDNQQVDVAHEALIRGWPRLRLWIDEHRPALHIHRRITEDAQEWQRLGRDRGALYRGIRLTQALEWRKQYGEELNPLEREFLDMSDAQMYPAFSHNGVGCHWNNSLASWSIDGEDVIISSTDKHGGDGGIPIPSVYKGRYIKIVFSIHVLEGSCSVGFDKYREALFLSNGYFRPPYKGTVEIEGEIPNDDSSYIAIVRLERNSKVRIIGFTLYASEQIQEDTDLLEFTILRIDMRHKTIVVGNRSIKLTEREFLTYALFAYMRQESRGANGFVQLEEITMDDLDIIFRRITKARGQEFGLHNCLDVPRFNFLPTLAEQLTSKQPMDRKGVTQTMQEITSRIRHKFAVQHVPERYFITTFREGGALRYGIHVALRHITWDD
jgi:hypothetical protein